MLICADCKKPVAECGCPNLLERLHHAVEQLLKIAQKYRDDPHREDMCLQVAATLDRARADIAETRLSRPYMPKQVLQYGFKPVEDYWRCDHCTFSTYVMQEAINHARHWLGHSMTCDKRGAKRG